MSEIELKACPFCWRKPRISDLPESAIHVSCRCGASLFGERRHHDSHAEAAARWNTRATQWQPIDSAPKDGRWIMLGKPGHNEVLLAYWDRLRGAWWGQGGGDGQWKKWQDASSWQPLPAPPEVEG